MSLKKISCLCIVLLLFAGMVGVADAATPQGVRLRVTHPANDAWSGIGDSVVVKVQYLPGTAALDSVVVAIVEDTSSSTISDAIGSLTNDSADDFVHRFNAANASAADATGFKTFTATFKVTAGQTVESSAKTLSLSALVSTTGSAAFSHLTNLNTEATITGSTSFGNVGDGVKIGIDAQRPAANIDSVRLDTTGIGNFPNDGGGTGSDGLNESDNPKKAYKVGSKVKVSFFVSNVPGGSSGIVHLADTANADALPDSAMKTVNFSFSDLVSGSATDSSVTLSAGDVKGDNRRIVAVGFLKDAAGNLSSTNASDVTPVGVTDVDMHVLDLTAPTITPHFPKSGATDSTHFTAVVDTSLKIVAASGTLTTTTFAAQPLKFAASEGANSATAKFGDSTRTLTGIATKIKSSSLSSNFAVDFGAGNAAQGGKSGTLEIAFKDSVGNETKSSQASVTYDKTAPGIKSGSLFPTSSSAPTDAANANKPTVNRDTMMPILQLLEVTDSMAVTYTTVTAGTATQIKHKMAPGTADLANTTSEIKVIFVDTLKSNSEYSLQFLMRDLAGNHNATAADTLTFDADFKNPVADSFVVKANGSDDTVIAGQALILDITGIDTALTNSAGSNRAAVTHQTAATIRISNGANDLSTVVFSGTGVTDNKDGTATLSADGWTLGARSVNITSQKALTAFKAHVEDKTGTDVNFSGMIDSLSVNSSNFSAYNVAVVADADGGDTATGVSGGFKVSVTPADEFGNPSAKVFMQAAPTRADSTSLTDAKVGKDESIVEILAEFSSNRGDVALPQGPQSVAAGGSTFTIGGASASGSDLVISVRTVNSDSDTLGIGGDATKDHALASGSVTLAFAPEGVAATPATLAAPASLLVQDWKGADGKGDHGGFVSVAFPKAASADRYRIFREVSVSTGLDADGKLVALETPANAWVSWTVIDNIAADDVQRAVVPTLDNVATKWAVASESGGSSSERASTKRVFTKQIVQNMVKFLGVDPNRVLSMTELEQVFTPGDDYVKSIIGDTGFRFVAIDPDLTAMLGGASTVPTNIRTQAEKVSVSSRTAIETAVKAVDNIPPAAITELASANDGSVVTLSWTASVDDKVVAYSSYKGYSMPIDGVDRYDILRGADEASLELVGSVDGGVTSFTEDIGSLTNVIYRVDAADLDNATSAPTVSVSVAARVVALDASGNAIYLIDQNDGTPLTVDFGDFIAFAGAFNTVIDGPGYIANADTNDDGAVDFTDFLNFAGSFNSVAATVNGQPAGSTKVIPRTLQPGVNDNVELSLNLESNKVLVGQTVTLNVSVDNAASLQGFGFGLTYDTDKFEFVNATPAEEDLLKADGAETPVFLMNEDAPGELSIANAIVDGSPVTGTGDVVSLTFRVLTEFEDNARFEIAEGVVFDGSKLTNFVVALGNLNVESTPTEFALLQNFPNPFNPETTIKYNLADGKNVSLRIYNVVGQVVRTLVAEQQNAGRYTVRWNGTDDRGVSVSSGIYFYQIAAGDYSDVKKLMLLK